MQFSKIIGKIDPNLVSAAEKKLSKVFIELGIKYDNRSVGSGMGGDPLIFGLIYPVEHVCTLNIPTAATDGKRFYWNPKFVLKQSIIGLRILCSHEAWHAIYMHPTRRGSRLPKLWNIAVDYIVNGNSMDDLKARNMNPGNTFTKELGKYLTIQQFAEMIKNPFAAINELGDISSTQNNSNIKLPSPSEDRELSEQEQQELERRQKSVRFYYADPDLSDDMKRPERIYDYLYNLLPKCPKCGSIGKYKLPNKDKSKSNSKNKSKGKGKDKGQGQDQDQDQDQGQGHSCGTHKCDECGGEIDIFELGGTVDEHMDAEESQEKMAQRISDAMETAKRMAGVIPAALEEELGKLTAPKITWQDIIRTRIIKARAGNGHNDWTRFRTRPMFSGLLVPKRKNYYANFGCLLDTSGSMSKDDIAFGLSQLSSLDERSEGTIVPADANIYWDKATKIKRFVQEEISKVKVVGRGGTKYAEFFTDYEKNIGKCDFLIIITDGYLLDTDIADMINPGIDTIWLITSGSVFKPPFGKAYDLKD